MNKMFVKKKDIAPGTPEDFKKWHSEMCEEGVIFIPYKEWLDMRVSIHDTPIVGERVCETGNANIDHMLNSREKLKLISEFVKQYIRERVCPESSDIFNSIASNCDYEGWGRGDIEKRMMTMMANAIYDWCEAFEYAKEKEKGESK